MKRNIVIGALMLIVGIVGGWLCRGRHFREEVKMVESDTVYVYKYKSYSHLDLKGRTYKLDVPVVGVPDVIFIREDSTAVEYRDSIRYITAPREFFYTMTPEVEIWHSGIGSRIDSLNVHVRNSVITNKIVPKEKKHGLSLGVELGYMNGLTLPIYLEYERLLQKNVGIYGQMLYDLNARQFGIGIGLEVSIGW
jgi:hypothetical protein